jgi:hypothetical protein
LYEYTIFEGLYYFLMITRHKRKAFQIPGDASSPLKRKASSSENAISGFFPSFKCHLTESFGARSSNQIESDTIRIWTGNIGYKLIIFA